MPRLPPGGVPETARKDLQNNRECANQILKAAMAINGNALAEMEIPDSYLDSLPKVAISAIISFISKLLYKTYYEHFCAS